MRWFSLEQGPLNNVYRERRIEIDVSLVKSVRNRITIDRHWFTLEMILKKRGVSPIQVL